MRRTILKPAVAACAILFAAQASAQITFYEREGFRGRTFSTERPVNDLTRFGYNDRASSVVVDRGRWEVCEDARFGGHCAVLRRGSYDSLRSMGLQNQVSSVRPAGRAAVADGPVPPMDRPNYAYRRRPNERLFEAPVRTVRAVVGPPERRCWVEQQATGQRPDLNVPGAVIGGVLGGILGHQVGGGSGRTVATIGGAVAGGALGANVDRIRNGGGTRDVQRCENVASGDPQYYDVEYTFRGQTHHAQLDSHPGRTITVNGQGEPRS